MKNTTIRHRFASYLENELAIRGLKPVDVLHKNWNKETKEAVKAAMSKSPVLFHPGAVAEWLGKNSCHIAQMISK